MIGDYQQDTGGDEKRRENETKTGSKSTTDGRRQKIKVKQEIQGHKEPEGQGYQNIIKNQETPETLEPKNTENTRGAKSVISNQELKSHPEHEKIQIYKRNHKTRVRRQVVTITGDF